MDIKPFKAAIEAAVPDKGLVSVRGFYRRLRLLFGNYTISADGIDLSQPDQNRLHLKVTANGSGSSDYPFKVTLTTTSGGTPAIEVQPGLVYCPQSASQTTQPGSCIPTMNGVALTNDPAPQLTVNPAQAFVLLRAQFDTNGSVLAWPWEIITASTRPNDTTVVRDTGNNVAGNDPRAGDYHLLIATIKDSVITPWARGNFNVDLSWQNLNVIVP